ncbi:MAG: TIGR04255 family protein [Promethearchaeota archaeon]
MVKVTESLLKETFPNTFLDSVACEVRFNTDLTIKEKIIKFQNIIKDTFPTYIESLSIPIGFPSTVEKTNIMNYIFKNEDIDTEVYLNTFSIFGIRTNNYSNYDDFSKLFLKILKEFIKLCNISHFTRLGLRYINVIPLDKDRIKANDLKKKYFYSFLKENFEKNDFESQHLSLKYYEKKYEIHQQFIFRKSKNKIYEVIIDIDNSLKNKINISEDKELRKFQNIINELHALIKIKFFETITESFLKRLRED